MFKVNATKKDMSGNTRLFNAINRNFEFYNNALSYFESALKGLKSGCYENLIDSSIDEITIYLDDSSVTVKID